MSGFGNLTGLVQTENTQQGQPVLPFPVDPPRFLSPAFHIDFFPKVLLYRHRQYKNRGINKKEHVLFEIPLMIAACVLVVVVGLPSALEGSVAGIIVSAIGGLGLIAMVTGAVISEYRYRARSGYSYTYESFVPSIFVFFVILGLTAGLLTGGVVYESQRLALAGALAGLVTGYAAGIFAGLWIHCLGFMATWFIYLANVATLLMAAGNLFIIFFILRQGGGQ